MACDLGIEPRPPEYIPGALPPELPSLGEINLDGELMWIASLLPL